MQFVLAAPPTYPRCNPHPRPAAAFRRSSCRPAPWRATSDGKPKAASSRPAQDQLVASDGGSTGDAATPSATSSSRSSSSTGQPALPAAGDDLTSAGPWTAADASSDSSLAPPEDGNSSNSSPSSDSSPSSGTDASPSSQVRLPQLQQQVPPADSNNPAVVLPPVQDEAAALAQAQQELEDSWHALTYTFTTLFLPNRTTTTSSSSSNEAAAGAASASSGTPPPLPQLLGRLFSGAFLQDYKQLEQQWRQQATPSSRASTAAAAGRQGGEDEDSPSYRPTSSSSSSSSSSGGYVPASQQVVDVEVAAPSPQPPPPPPPTTSSSSTDSTVQPAAAPPDPWQQQQQPAPPGPSAAATEASEEEDDMSDVLPASQLLQLPGTSILVYSIWGVWVVSWLTVVPAVVAAVQVGELGRVCSALLLSYPGISPLVQHLSADLGRLAAGHWGGLLGSCLLHSGLVSVAACAAGIQDAGEELEPLLGMYQLLLLFLVAGVGAAVTHYRCGGGPVLLSGAGAVAGLYGGWLALAVAEGPEVLPYGSNLGLLVLLGLLGLGAWQPAVGVWSVVGGFFTGVVGVFAVPHLGAALGFLLYVPMVTVLLLLRLAWALVGVVFASAVLLVLSTVKAVQDVISTIRNL